MRDRQGWPIWNYIDCVNWVGKTLPWAGQQDCGEYRRDEY